MGLEEILQGSARHRAPAADGRGSLRARQGEGARHRERAAALGGHGAGAVNAKVT